MLPSWVIYPITIAGFIIATLAAVWLINQLVVNYMFKIRISRPRRHREKVLWCMMERYIQEDYIISPERDMEAMCAFVRQEIGDDNATDR